MQKISVVLETLTPLFLAGADPRGLPELRAPSIRGALRYWLRALLGGVYGDSASALQQLNERETAIFGDNQTGSNIVCQIQKITKKNIATLQLSEQRPGEKYLLWANSRGKDGRKFLEQTEFTLSIKTRIGGKMLESDFGLTAASLWLLLHLGGIGTRSRRLMGSLRVKQVNEWPQQLPGLHVTAHEPAKLAEILVSALEQWRDFAGGDTKARFERESRFDVLHPNHSAIFVWNADSDSADNLIEEFGKNLQAGRFHKPPDDKTVLEVIQGNKNAEKLQRPGFGLPLRFLFRSELAKIAKANNMSLSDAMKDRDLQKLATATLEPSRRDRDQDESKRLSRRASPVHFHVASLRDDHYTVVGTFFKSQFLPADANIRVRPGNQQSAQYLKFGGYGLVQEYLNSQSAFELDFAAGKVKAHERQ